jgi:ABC-2 type transport system permease protein
MAVHERTYRRYEGSLTPRWSRFLVVARYAREEVFKTRIVTAFFALCFAVPLGMGVFIYLHHNAGALLILNINPQDLLPIDGQFFRVYLAIQGVLGFLLTALVAPGLVAPDLAHQALPLYLARPFSRSEYVAGKLTVLGVLLSLVTWVPGAVLWFIQVQLQGRSWLAAHPRVGPALVIGGLVAVLIYALLGLALSAWARWRTVAAGLLFGVFAGGRALAAIVNEMFDTRWGSLFSLGELLDTVWNGLFGLTPSPGQVPTWAAGGALAVLAAFCLLLLYRKLEAYEVVR